MTVGAGIVGNCVTSQVIARSGQLPEVGGKRSLVRELAQVRSPVPVSDQ
ncbi:MAG TPA: hypothetical protein VIQ31_00770 [Phormidium sp.]